MTYEDFEIKKVHDGWIIKRRNDIYEMHSHFRKKKGCKDLLRIIVKKKQLPKSDYYTEAARRILYESEFKKLKRKKDTYNNKRRVVYGKAL